MVLFVRSRAVNSTICGWILLNFQFVRNFKVVIVSNKNEEDPNKNEGARELTRFFTITTLWELSVAMKNRVLILSGQNPHAAYAPDEMCFRSACWSQRYSQTPARVQLGAFGSSCIHKIPSAHALLCFQNLSDPRFLLIILKW